MNQIVFIVEDDPHVKRLLSTVLERNEISFIFASNLNDAIQLFERNKELISYIALDGSLSEKKWTRDYPETLVLAEIIADSKVFKGTTFAMSSTPIHCKILKKIIGDKCEIFNGKSAFTIKFDTIQEIARRIIEKKQKKEKTH